MAIVKKTYHKHSHLEDAFRSGESTFIEVLTQMVTNLKIATYDHIVKLEYMPEWRQTKWDKYIDLFERDSAGEILSVYNQGFFEGFPDAPETPLECYTNALLAMNWILECTTSHNIKENELMSATNMEELLAVTNPDYPVWPL